MIKEVDKGIQGFLKQYQVSLSSDMEFLNDEETLQRLLAASIVTEFANGEKPPRKKRGRKAKPSVSDEKVPRSGDNPSPMV